MSKKSELNNKKHDPGSHQSTHSNVFRYLQGLSREDLPLMGILIFLTLLPRIILTFEISEIPLYQYLFSDSKIYWDWATGILKGDNAYINSVFFMSPVYPYFLAIVRNIADDSVLLIRLVQVIISSVTILFIYLAAKNIAGRNTAVIAAIFFAFSLELIVYANLLLTETIQVFIASLLIFLFSTSDLLRSGTKLFLTGIIIGLLIVIRGSALLLIPFVIGAIYYFMKKNGVVDFRKIGILLAGVILSIMPLTLHNLIRGNEFVILTSNGGINLWIGNNPNAQGVFIAPNEFEFYEDISGKKYAESVVGKNLSHSEADSYWINRSLNFISEYSATTMQLFFTKILLFIGTQENPQSSVMNPYLLREQYSKVLKLPLISFWVVFILFLISLKQYRIEDARYVLISGFVITMIFATSLFFVTGRFRLVVLPALIVLGAIGAETVYQKLLEKNTKWLKNIGLIVVAYFLIDAFITPKFHYTPYDAHLNLGATYFDRHEYDKALEEYNKSLGFQETYSALMGLGNVYAVKKEFNQAIHYYERALKIRPEYYLIHYNLGLMYGQSGKLENAEKSFQKTLSLNPRHYETFRNLGIIHYMNGKHREALDYFERYLPHCTDPAVKKSILSDIELLKKTLSQNTESLQ